MPTVLTTRFYSFETQAKAKSEPKQKPKQKRHGRPSIQPQDDSDHGSSQDEVVAPALRARFSHDAFQRCCKLADAVIVYLVKLQAGLATDEMARKLVRVAA